MPTIGEVLGHDYVTVVAFGDSITEVNHWTLGGLNWVGLLQANLHTCFKRGFTVINSGISGDSVTGGLARLERDVLRFKPNLTIISFGMNDSTLPDNLERFTRDLKTMIHRIREGGGRILLRTPNPVIDMNDGSELTEVVLGGTTCKFALAEYAAAMVRTAIEERIWVVDHYLLWKESLASKYHGEMVMLMGNGIHPNANGHRRFYAELAPVFGAELFFQNEWQHILEKQEADDET